MTDYFYSFEFLVFSGGCTTWVNTVWAGENLLALRDEENQ